jgi:hypothetical protein
MAEIEFILSEKEQGIFLQYLESLKAIFVPEILYPRPEFQYLHDANEAVSIWREANAKEGSGPIFLLWDGISTYKLIFRNIVKYGEQKFYLSQKEGGPYINFGPCKYLAEEKIITSGDIGYYSKYWIEELDDNITVSEEIKSKFNEISKFIKKMTKRIKSKSGKRSYWVGSEALKMLKNGSIANSRDLDI